MSFRGVLLLSGRGTLGLSNGRRLRRGLDWSSRNSRLCLGLGSRSLWHDWGGGWDSRSSGSRPGRDSRSNSGGGLDLSDGHRLIDAGRAGHPKSLLRMSCHGDWSEIRLWGGLCRRRGCDSRCQLLSRGPRLGWSFAGGIRGHIFRLAACCSGRLG